MAAATGKRASCLFKKRQQPKPPSASASAMLMRLVLVGWPSMELLVIGRRPWGRGWAWMTAGIQPAKSRLTEREGEKKSDRGRVRRERERERGRQAHRLHNARLGPVLMCFLFWHVFLNL